jgi:hypothetical protein
MSGDEEGREAALASGEPERERDMGLAGSAIAEGDEVLAASDILAAGKLQHEHLVEAGDGGEIECLEVLDRRKPCLAVEKLKLDEAQQVTDMVDAIAGGLARDLLVSAQDGWQFQPAFARSCNNLRCFLGDSAMTISTTLADIRFIN